MKFIKDFRKIRILEQRAVNRGYIKASKVYAQEIKKLNKAHIKTIIDIHESSIALADILEKRIDEYGQLITKKEDEIKSVRIYANRLESIDDRRLAINDEIIKNSQRLNNYLNGYDATVKEFRKKHLGHA